MTWLPAALNSDCDGRSDDGDEAEVQSSYKGPLDTMDALEDSLPMRRGISTFYYGKSKSFTNLTDALPSSSSKSLAKPKNSYSRKRKKLLAFNLWEKPNRNSQRSDKDITVSKRPANFSRRKEGLGPSTSSSSESNSCSSGNKEAAARVSASNSNKWFSNPLKSFSFADLQGALSSRTYFKSGDKQSRFR
ncbi:uncharacterized protein A4U43_C06F4280 [Asparagus officinalis]|uniref:Uncharacterized protein n=1 Tax=Asparagus officinalis TaxID=4686 RepID=A0A5P1EKA7_ASPOF|nr:uncharacterized protein LOC109845688 [Asparagus officinalis]ONK66113.1 uncharacterized protein A4U43_C06F4280 [Asparagus officinalis]